MATIRDTARQRLSKLKETPKPKAQPKSQSAKAIEDRITQEKALRKEVGGGRGKGRGRY